ncbi:ComF family protein [Paenibacillus sp. sgz5001063]|uniref:ComF family protein n=1 Tax=Paenibacillus sp. sgz5001063 TaxID=3242474 RepID=UPI0036D387CF
MNRSAVTYNGQMREWLAQYKFRGNEAYGPLLARMAGWAAKAMKSELSSQRIDAPARNFRFDAVTYVPASSDRMMERGFNQAEQLALGVGAACRIPVLSLLERICHTEKQSLKSRRERIRDLQGVYGILPDSSERLITAIGNLEKKHVFKRPYFKINLRRETFGMDLLSPLRIIVVDDVYTTGSTVNACSKLIHDICTRIGRPVEVYIITWARS